MISGHQTPRLGLPSQSEASSLQYLANTKLCCFVSRDGLCDQCDGLHKSQRPQVKPTTQVQCPNSCTTTECSCTKHANNQRLRYVVHSRGGCNPHHSTTTLANLEITSSWRHNSETIRDREKRKPIRPMKFSKLSNGENCIALQQLLQNRKLRHLWRHNLGSKWKLRKMARENFSIGAFYNITKNQHNPIKTVGQDSFLSPKPPKNTSLFVQVWSKSDQRRLRKTLHKQTDRQTDKQTLRK